MSIRHSFKTPTHLAIILCYSIHTNHIAVLVMSLYSPYGQSRTEYSESSSPLLPFDLARVHHSETGICSSLIWTEPGCRACILLPPLMAKVEQRAGSAPRGQSRTACLLPFRVCSWYGPIRAIHRAYGHVCPLWWTAVQRTWDLLPLIWTDPSQYSGVMSRAPVKCVIIIENFYRLLVSHQLNSIHRYIPK